MTTCRHDATGLAHAFTARDYVTGDSFAVGECTACGLTVTSPAPSGAELARYYPDSYYGTRTERRFPGVVEQLQNALFSRRARAVERATGGAGRVLDVGCGRGFLLDAFRRRGWSVQGTELSEASGRYARDVLGIPVLVGDETTWPWDDASFDAVVVWHVLEHSADPRSLLGAVRRVLRPGGTLLVSVPNFGSVEARVTKDGWFHLDVPRHVTHFTPRTLAEFLCGEGFAVRKTSYFAPEYDTFSFVQSSLNALRFRQNRLYDLLRSRSAKLGRRERLLPSLATVAAAIPLGVIAPLATTALSLAKRGSTVTVLAVRAD